MAFLVANEAFCHAEMYFALFFKQPLIFPNLADADNGPLVLQRDGDTVASWPLILH